MSRVCSDEVLERLVQDMQAGRDDQLPRIEELLREADEDGRLHFLHGSMLVGSGRLIEGYNALKRAVILAPDMPIARFQLGFLQLTSGETRNALETFGGLDALPDDHYLRKFVDGLRCLIRDDFRGTIANLRAGIELNQENLPLSRDMGLIIEQCEAMLVSGKDDAAAVSETSFMLKQFSRAMN